MLDSESPSKHESSSEEPSPDGEKSSLDVTSFDFDPSKALSSSQPPVPVPVEDLRVFDNIGLYESYVRRGGTAFEAKEEEEELARHRANQAQRARKAEHARQVKAESAKPKVVPTSGREGAVAVIDPRYTSEETEAESREEPEGATGSVGTHDGNKSESRRGNNEPSKGLYANLIEGFKGLSLLEKSHQREELSSSSTRASRRTRKSDAQLEEIPPAILVFKKVKGNRGKRVVLKRHVPMLMIRGENIVTVSCAS